MEDNSAARLHDVFFYGLYMDPDLIKGKGASPRNPRKASVRGFALRVGKKATLLRQAGAVTQGMIYALTHGEIDALYRGAGLTEHLPEALLADLESGEKIPVLCCNLLNPPGPEESNPDYIAKLQSLKRRLGLQQT
jgi:hypothetical protein